MPDVRQFKAYRRPISFANNIDHCLLTEVDVDGLVRPDSPPPMIPDLWVIV